MRPLAFDRLLTKERTNVACVKYIMHFKSVTQLELTGSLVARAKGKSPSRALTFSSRGGWIPVTCSFLPITFVAQRSNGGWKNIPQRSVVPVLLSVAARRGHVT